MTVQRNVSPRCTFIVWYLFLRRIDVVCSLFMQTCATIQCQICACIVCGCGLCANACILHQLVARKTVDLVNFFLCIFSFTSFWRLCFVCDNEFFAWALVNWKEVVGLADSTLSNKFARHQAKEKYQCFQGKQRFHGWPFLIDFPHTHTKTDSLYLTVNLKVKMANETQKPTRKKRSKNHNHLVTVRWKTVTSLISIRGITFQLDFFYGDCVPNDQCTSSVCFRKLNICGMRNADAKFVCVV